MPSRISGFERLTNMMKELDCERFLGGIKDEDLVYLTVSFSTEVWLLY